MAVATQITVTPYRKTHFKMDVSETVTEEPVFSIQRAAAEIARGGADATGSLHVEFIPAGFWQLQPLPASTDQERTDNESPTISNVIRAASIELINMFRNPSGEVTGLSPDSNVATTADEYAVKRITSGSSWDNNNSSTTADATAFGQPTLPTTNFPMDRQFIGTDTFSANKSFYFQVIIPGTPGHSHDNLGTFYFGGPAGSSSADAVGNGEYALSIRGDGTAQLFEHGNGSSRYVWNSRDAWQYAEVSKLSAGTKVRIDVLPCQDVNFSGKTVGYLYFRASLGDGVGAGSGSMFLSSPSGALYRTSGHLYTVPNTGRTVVTGAGPVRIDIPRHLRVPHKASVTRYYTAGTLKDYPYIIPFDPDPSIYFTLAWVANTPSGTTITATLHDASDDSELTQVSSTATSKTYEPNAGSQKYYAKFYLQGDGTNTPQLFNYGVFRGSYNSATGTTTVEGGTLTSVSITGAESDPSHETANISLADLKNELILLRTRSSFCAQIETEYHTTDTSKRSILFRGYAARCRGKRMGTGGGSGMSGTDTKAYPHPEWKHYDITLLGTWQRLTETLLPGRYFLMNDPATEGKLPYKVTDTLKFLLSVAGFLDSEVDITDAEMRFFATDADSMILEPLTPIADIVVKMARDYLGGFLVYDPNAGSTGMWRLIYPSRPPYTAIWTFTTAGTTTKKGAWPGSYNSTAATGRDNWVGWQGTTFIRKGTLETDIKPPEANYIVVSGTGEILPNKSGNKLIVKSATNYDSLNDTSSRDYLGRLKPLYYVDRTLGTEEAVAWVLRRLYDFVAHGILIAYFDAPLVLVEDPSDTYRTNPRPLRFADVVNVTTPSGTSTYIIRNVNPTYRKDAVQMARYEVQSPLY